MRRRIMLMVFLLPLLLHGQPGGRYAFTFLEIPVSARQAALGGGQVPVFDGDATLLPTDPSQLNRRMHNQVVLSYLDYFAGINAGYLGYSRNTGRHPWFAGIQYLNYGTFTAADETGLVTGEFTAADYAFIAGTSRKFADTSFTIGMSVKGIFSQLEGYSSWGLAGDLAIGWHRPDLGLGASLVASNFGYQFRPYQEGVRHPLPVNLRAGVTKQLARAPLRFFLTYHHLQRFNQTYFDSTSVPAVNNLTGEPVEIREPGFADRLARHLVVGAELFPLKNFILRLGYNYRRRQEMVVPSRPGTAGFSWGLGLNLRKFHLNYARSSYHLAGGTNHFSLVLKLNGAP